MTTVHFAIVLTVVCGATSVDITAEERKCLEADSVWKIIREKCSKPCAACPYGMGRNFDNLDKLTRKANGELRCPPCEECQIGYFNDNRRVRCTLCVMDCSSLHRHVHQECSKVQDASCGSCLPGYYDAYGSVDFPCFLDDGDVTVPEVENGNKAQMQSNIDYSTSRDNLQINDRQQKPQTPHGRRTAAAAAATTTTMLDRHPNHDGKNIHLAVIIVLVILLLIMIIIGCVLKWKNCEVLHQNLEEFICRLKRQRIDDHEGDIEVESENTGRKIAHYARQNSNDVHCEIRTSNDRNSMLESNYRPKRQIINDHEGDLEVDAAPCNNENTGRKITFNAQQNARSEIRTTYDRNSMQGALLGTETDDQNTQQNYQKIGKHCSCRLIPSCRSCDSLKKGPARLLRRSDPVFTLVAPHICHDPTSFFKLLGVPEWDIYQKNNDRDRNPEEVTEAEMVFRLLQAWVEKTPDDASLKALGTALCEAGFHHIVEKIQVNLRAQIFRNCDTRFKTPSAQ